jgi:hypothetical protein
MGCLDDLPTMAIAWEGIEVASRLSREVVVDVPEGEGFGDQFRLQFRVVLAQAMVRVAEADLKWHQEQAHFVRSLVAQRKVARRKKALLRAMEPDAAPVAEQPAVSAAPAVIRRTAADLEIPWYRLPGKHTDVAPEPAPETGDRVVTYLQLGVRNSRAARNVRVVRRI